MELICSGALIKLRDQYLKSQDRVKQLEKENIELKKQLEQEKIKATNKQISKPSSKHAEWEKGGKPDTDKGKKKRRGCIRKPRKGAGNRPKNLKPNREETVGVHKCVLCGKDLKDQPPLESTN